MREINEIILHCSATPSTQDIGVKEITRWHTLPEPQGRGWSHIGYHYVIRRNGKLETGCPIETPGIHCSGHNARTIGICLVGGGLNGEDKYFAEAQFDELAALLKDLRQRWPLASIHGHNEYANKACPVYDVQKFLDRYGITKDPWSRERWPHFKPAEFDALWGKGEMPKVWSKALDALERLREKYGKPLVILKSEYRPSVPVLSCLIRVPEPDRVQFVKLAVSVGFGSALAADNGVRVYSVVEGTCNN